MTELNCTSTLASRAQALVRRGPEAESARFIFTLSQNLILTIERSVLSGRVDEGFDIASAEMAQLLLGFAAASVLLLESLSNPDRTAQSRRCSSTKTSSRPSASNSMAAVDLMDQCIRDSLQHQYASALDAPELASSRSAANPIWSARFRSKLTCFAASCSLLALFDIAEEGISSSGQLDLETVQDLLAVTDTTIGIFHALRWERLDCRHDITQMALSMQAHLNSSRMACGSREAKARMSSLVHTLLDTMTAAMRGKTCNDADARLQ